MTPDTTDDANGRTRADDQSRRYAELAIGNEEFVIYDRENHEAWIQSSTSLDVADLR